MSNLVSNSIVLPVGSIVSLKNATVELAIIGYGGIDPSGNVHDYIGVPWPAGMMSKDSILLFDAEKIEETIFFGYSDLKSQAFGIKMAEAAQNGKAPIPMLKDLENQNDSNEGNPDPE